MTVSNNNTNQCHCNYEVKYMRVGLKTQNGQCLCTVTGCRVTLHRRRKDLRGQNFRGPHAATSVGFSNRAQRWPKTCSSSYTDEPELFSLCLLASWAAGSYRALHRSRSRPAAASTAAQQVQVLVLKATGRRGQVRNREKGSRGAERTGGGEAAGAAPPHLAQAGAPVRTRPAPPGLRAGRMRGASR